MSHPTTTPPPPTPTFLNLSFPAPRVLLVRMNRPSALNALSTAGLWEMDRVWRWLDDEPNLSVAVITGTGRAFSAGADLKEWNESMAPGADPSRRVGNAPAFKLLSRRLGKKPVVAAVNGLAMGGGCEFVVNCDIVVAAEGAMFGLPEVKRGLSPIAGVLPRLIRTLGLQRAAELALMGEPISAQKAYEWGIVNKIVKEEDVIDEAVKYAAAIAKNSPDAIICTRAGLRQGWETASVERAVEITLEREFSELQKGENIKEGLKAFSEKRQPVWKGGRL